MPDVRGKDWFLLALRPAGPEVWVDACVRYRDVTETELRAMMIRWRYNPDIRAMIHPFSAKATAEQVFETFKGLSDEDKWELYQMARRL
jgi:hypothetical protein